MISSILFIVEVQNSVVNVELLSCVKYAYLQSFFLVNDQ